MNWSGSLLWGLVATVMLTTISSATQGLGLTRMNIPYILGTMFTPNRDRARLYGFFAHLGFGWAFSLIYALIFEAVGTAGWWRGLIIGVLHAFFVLTVLMSLLPGLHPRMASERHGPEAHAMLEPPGFLALNYGARTPIVVIISHALFGVILGIFYQVK
jgi:uncharacterized membrane protein YagU involved in acid resistance